MFGHQDDDSQQQAAVYVDPQAVPASPIVAPVYFDNNYAASATADDTSTSTSTPPLLETQATDGYVSDPIAPILQAPPSFGEPTAVNVSAPPLQAAPAAAIDGDSLLSIKQQVLQQLSPLVGQLEQSPEEKFRTTMMMIQASDNQDLIQTAYEIAGQIPDEKARAQALLDIVNEINYFTQHATE
jgi:hypothetical protein